MTAASALFKRALSKFRARDVRGGWIDLDEAISIDPSQWEYFWTRGAFHYRRHAYYSAEEDLTKAVDLCPDDKSAARIYERRMFCYGYIEKPDRVVQDANWLIEHGFASHNLYQWRGWSRFRIGDTNGALEDANMMINSIHQTPYFGNESLLFSAYQFRSVVLYRMGDFEKSLEDYNRANKVAGQEQIPDVQSYRKRMEDHIDMVDTVDIVFSRMSLKPAPVITLAKSRDE